MHGAWDLGECNGEGTSGLVQAWDLGGPLLNLLNVPRSQACELGFTNDLKPYTKRIDLGVGFQTVCKSELARPRTRYIKRVLDY